MSDLLQQRKDHHIDIVLGEQVTGHGPAVGFGRYTLEYDALPEVDLEDVDLSTTVLGRPLSAPLLVGAMTGGTDRTGEINRMLARAASRVGLGMALGSQRAMLKHRASASSFDVRDAAPDLSLLIGNIGGVQLNYGVGVDDLRWLVERVGVDALNVHLNALQEAIQPEGDTRFRGVADKLREVLPQLPVPALVKEVGAGISERAARKLVDLPIAGIEVAGTGGTSWAAVEAYRAGGDAHRAAAGIRLAGFGVPTVDSLRIVRSVAADKVVVASGGVRTGMDIAVALALGADAVALAKPFLEAAQEGEDAVVKVMEGLLFDLKVICFCTGADSLEALRQVRVVDLRGGYRPLESL